ncbi:MAG: TetR family transcriptional regulator C-terminal domain-containing protein [Propionibacteriaceae bacterium]|nr:TetR family transcriptional regulator C-terminal domain-containing protein [Propionibacteriaceae bacterium]
MPKVVNAEERRELIVDAVFRLVARGGVEAASLRNVAVESGLNIGSVRHYVESHDALMLAATEAMAERVGRRVEDRVRAAQSSSLVGDGPATEAAIVDLYAQLLPLDAARRGECAVWLAFLERSRVNPELRGAAEQMHREVVRVTTEWLTAAGVPEAADRAALLTTGVDGLTLAALSWPDDYPPDRQLRLLGGLLRQAFVDTRGLGSAE